MNFKLFTLSALTTLCVSGFSFSSYAAKADMAGHNKEYNMLVWLSAVDKNEITSAKIALKNSKNAEVKSYAEEMVNDHGKNLKETNQLMKKTGAPSHPEASINPMNEKEKMEVNKLKDLKGADFDTAYIGAMVKAHTEALNTLDKDIASLDSSSKIETHLRETQAVVSAHLDKAKALQSTLSK